jgi:hypothetical protein
MVAGDKTGNNAITHLFDGTRIVLQHVQFQNRNKFFVRLCSQHGRQQSVTTEIIRGGTKSIAQSRQERGFCTDCARKQASMKSRKDHSQKQLSNVNK